MAWGMRSVVMPQSALWAVPPRRPACAAFSAEDVLKEPAHMKRTRFALFSAAALVAAAVAGCSSSGSTAAAAAASPGSAKFGVNATGTVQFWARTVSKTLAQKLVSEFNATHSNLKVKLTLTSINDDVTSLATSIRAGDPPDVVGLNDIDTPTFTREGAFMNLTQYINALPYKADLSPGHVGLATYNGAEYG